MTKTNEQTATVSRRAKKVLTERDFLPEGAETAAEMSKRMARELAAESKATGAPRAAAALANGVTARNAPQSAKAVSDGKAKATNKADAATQKPSKAAKAPKAAKAAKPAKADKRSLAITLLVKPADTTLKGGRLAKLAAVAKRKPKTVADIVGTVVVDDTGKEHVLDMGALNGMVKRGHIALA